MTKKAKKQESAENRDYRKRLTRLSRGKCPVHGAAFIQQNGETRGRYCRLVCPKTGCFAQLDVPWGKLHNPSAWPGRNLLARKIAPKPKQADPVAGPARKSCKQPRIIGPSWICVGTLLGGAPCMSNNPSGGLRFGTAIACERCGHPKPATDAYPLRSEIVHEDLAP